MFQRLFSVLAVLSLWATMFAPAYGRADTIKASADEEKTKVEVSFATEHVPEGLKAGAKVNLLIVNGKTVAGGKVAYQTTVLVQSVEVAEVTAVEKPKTPEQAVKVELSVSKEQSAKIEKAKAQLVMVTEVAPDGTVKTEKRPLTFRLEAAK